MKGSSSYFYYKTKGVCNAMVLVTPRALRKKTGENQGNICLNIPLTKRREFDNMSSMIPVNSVYITPPSPQT
jgi:hypothetical protein